MSHTLLMEEEFEVDDVEQDPNQIHGIDEDISDL